jgi:hypothetical protein
MALITSRYTMDKQTDAIRRHLSEHADLLGAIRLPNTAFKANAGTEVTTDILFLLKRLPGTEAAGHAWRGLEMIDSADGPIAVSTLAKRRWRGTTAQGDRWATSVKRTRRSIPQFHLAKLKIAFRWATSLDLWQWDLNRGSGQRITIDPSIDGAR